jgi:hypothetical protein
MKKSISTTIALAVSLMIILTGATSFKAQRESTTQPIKVFLKDGKMMTTDNGQQVQIGYYTVSGGSSNPNTHHPWDDSGGSYGISGLDPRTVQLFPSFGGGGTYTFTKLSSNPSSLTLYGAGSGSSCYVVFNTWGQVITIQVTKGSESHVVSFYFTS